MAHDLSPLFLKTRALFFSPLLNSWRPLLWRDLNFQNPIGIAGGVDKDASCVQGWWTYGPGFIEVGTVTPKPQRANPPPIIARDVQSRALWNKMGFPNAGLLAMRNQLKKISRPYFTPIFVNIGKNRETPLENAAQDYCELIRGLSDVADAFVINISSPNTSGLRQLFRPEFLQAFLSEIHLTRVACPRPRPLLLKLSPDLEDSDIDAVLSSSLDAKFDGWVICNTTSTRNTPSRFQNPPYRDSGGVSGDPLCIRSRQLLQTFMSRLGDDKGDRLLVSVGGVLTADEVAHRLDLGADLVQVYSALIFHGPDFFRLSCR